jgi:catechol 1,2-dioxygenase
MITAQGYQPFVTQLYFSGDDHIARDPFASSLHARKRILAVRTLPGGTKKVSYDISMSPKLAAETAVIDRLTGVYRDEKDQNNRLEFFKKGDLLWMKNEVYGQSFEYIGQNTFHYPGTPDNMGMTLRFELMPQGAVKVIRTQVDLKGATQITTALKKL